MSSHHFVREGQEPPLLILDTVPFGTAADLLEWAPLVIVTATALETVLTWGIKIDLVLAGKDHLPAMDQVLQEQQPVRIISVPDNDWLSGALAVAKEIQSPILHVVTGNAGAVIRRNDLFPENFILFDGEIRWVGVRSAFEKWVPRYQRFRVFPESVTGDLTTHGVVVNDGVFMAEREGVVRFASERSFWLAEG